MCGKNKKDRVRKVCIKVRFGATTMEDKGKSKCNGLDTQGRLGVLKFRLKVGKQEGEIR